MSSSIQIVGDEEVEEEQHQIQVVNQQQQQQQKKRQTPPLTSSSSSSSADEQSGGDTKKSRQERINDHQVKYDALIVDFETRRKRFCEMEAAHIASLDALGIEFEERGYGLLEALRNKQKMSGGGLSIGERERNDLKNEFKENMYRLKFELEVKARGFQEDFERVVEDFDLVNQSKLAIIEELQSKEKAALHDDMVELATMKELISAQKSELAIMKELISAHKAALDVENSKKAALDVENSNVILELRRLSATNKCLLETLRLLI